MGHSLSPLHALGKFPEINKLFASSCFHNFQSLPLMVNWVDMVVLDSNNKRGHVFEAWIRLMPNEFETYTFFLFSRYFGPD